MAKIAMTWRGATPLVCNNAAKADPDGTYCEAVADLKGKRKKSPEDRQLMARLEFSAGLYMDKKLGPCVPDQNVIAAVIEGARINRNGKDVAALVSCEQPFLPIRYKGPRDPEAMFEAGFVDMRIVSSNGKPGGPKVMRARPVFREWAIDPVLFVDDELDPQTVVIAAQDAGRRVGLCERKRFRWGRFAVENVKITKD